MKYLLLFSVSVFGFCCSPKLSPDAGWYRQHWVVVEMKGVPVQQSGGRRDAYINFEVGEKKFNGNGGCNQFNGNYSLNNRNITFSEVTRTKMSCEDIEFENTFLSVLGTVNRYEIAGSDIYLKRKNEILLILRAK